MSAPSLRRGLTAIVLALAIIAFPGAASLADDATTTDGGAPAVTDTTTPPADAATAPADSPADSDDAISPTQLSAPFAVGDVAVSGFSGATLATPTVPAGVDPLTETIIDPDGVSLRVFDLATLGGPTVGQVVEAPVKLAAPASQIGQVFGLAFDDGGGQGGTGVPNLYVAASSAYGLQIVSGPGADGATRLKQGAPGAKFMAGQFGGLPGGSPGAIYKIDGTTGAVSFLADTAFSGVPNTGAGIGNLAFDPQSQTLYASDLDTGLIHRFDLTHNAADLGQFDHGVAGRPGAGLAAVPDDGKTANIDDPGFDPADPSTWGFTQPERRVEALAVHDGRLYYSVADGPTIWSVALGADGSFDTTARLELQVKAAQPFAVTDIAFDSQGRMILAQRGTLQSPFDYGPFTTSPAAAETLRYTPAAAGGDTTDLWLPDPDEFPIGLPDGSRQGDGGVTLTNSYNPDGTLGATCQETLLTTGDDLRDNPALTDLPPGIANLHGIQLNDSSLAGAANTPPLLSAFVQFDSNQSNPQATGHIGDVEAVPCLAPPATAPPAEAPPPAIPEAGSQAESTSPAPALELPPANNPATSGLTLTKLPAATSCSTDGGCEFSIVVTNPGPDPVPGPFTVDDVFTAGGALLTNATLANAPNPPWVCGAGGDGSVACTDPGPIPVGNTELRLSFTPGDVGGATDVLNCVRPDDPTNPALILDAQPAPAANGAAAGGPATNADAQVTQQFPPQQCATIPLTPPTNAGGKTNPTNPGGGGTTTPTNPGGGGVTSPAETVGGITWVKEGPTTCTDTGECIFKIHVGNDTNQTINGPIKLLETLSSAQTADGQALFPKGTVISTPPTAPWTCTAAPTADVPSGFDCTDPNSLAPGGNADFSIGFKFNSGQAVKDINNCIFPQGADKPLCVDIPTPGNTAPANPATPTNPTTPATLPTTNTQPSPAEGQGTTPNGITLTKRALLAPCSDTGGGCQFVISINNNGTTEFDGPIDLTDVLTTGDGKPLPAASIEGNPAVTFPTGAGAPSINCGQGNNGSFTCSTPPAAPAKIAPGGKVIIQFSFKPGASNGASAVKNTVSMQNGPQNVGATNPLINGPMLRATKSTIATTCTPTCIFEIAVTNVGNADATGPFTIEDTFNGIAPNMTFTAINGGDFNCNSFTGELLCTDPKDATLAPGKSLRATVQIAGATVQGFYHNCALATGAPGTPTDTTFEDRCVTFQDQEPPPPAPHLKLLKIPLGATLGQQGECPANGPCTFSIVIDNTGNAPYIGTIEVDDSIDGNLADEITGAAGNDPDWVCLTRTAGTGFAGVMDNQGSSSGCINSKVSIDPGSGIAFGVTVFPGTAFGQSANGGNIMTNCAVIQLAPPITTDGKNSTDPDLRACATDKLDPFHVVASKDGDKTCTAGGECNYTVTLTDPGPVDHDAPVTLSDNFSPGAASIVSIEPPLPCATQPTQVPFTCTTPGNFPLKVGQKIDYHIVLQLPPDQTSLQNCATVSSGADDRANAGKSTPKSGASSCVSTTVTPPPGTGGTNPISQPQTPPTQLPATTPTVQPTQPSTPSLGDGGTNPISQPAACFSNMVSDGQGGCACPGGTNWNGSQCVPTPTGTAPPVQVLPQVQSPPPGTGTGGKNGTFQQTSPTTQQPQFFRPCPPGTFGRYPICRPIPGTGNGGKNGTFPQGSQTPQQPQFFRPCPPGTYGHYPICRRIPGTGTGGKNGNFPQGSQTPQTQTTRYCPPGTFGRYPICRPIPGTGTGGKNGTFPQTSPTTQQPQFFRPCPPGTYGHYPICRRISGTGTGGKNGTFPQGSQTPQTQTARYCPPGTFGHYPICRRIRGAGTGGTNGNSSPSSQTQQTTPTARRCPPYDVGHFPFCRRRFGPSSGAPASPAVPAPTDDQPEVIK